MIDGMSEICIDCIHQEVCRYECHSPSEHCNDRAVADDFRLQGKWHALNYHTCYCTNCHFDFDIMKCDFMTKMNFCPNCGADMRGDNE